MATTPLTKTGYTDEFTGTTTVKVDVDDNGFIVPAADATASKRMTFKGVNSTNSLVDNTTVIQAFLDLCNGSQDSLSNRAQVTWEVA